MLFDVVVELLVAVELDDEEESAKIPRFSRTWVKLSSAAAASKRLEFEALVRPPWRLAVTLLDPAKP